MKWLKENWFKFGIMTLGFCFAVLFGYGQYLSTQAHTLEVQNQTMHCANSFEGDVMRTCVERVRATLIF